MDDNWLYGNTPKEVLQIINDLNSQGYEDYEVRLKELAIASAVGFIQCGIETFDMEGLHMYFTWFFIEEGPLELVIEGDEVWTTPGRDRGPEADLQTFHIADPELPNELRRQIKLWSSYYKVIKQLEGKCTQSFAS